MKFSYWARLIRRCWPQCRAPLLALLGLGLPWLVFVRLAREVWEGEGLPGDRRILEVLHAHAGPAQDAAAGWLSRLGGPVGAVLLPVLVGLVLALMHRRRALIFFILAVAGSGLLNLAAKLVLARPRPALWVSAAPETSFSFPSGHSMAAAGLAAALALLAWPTRGRWLVVAGGAAWALGVGWSRLYLGVHYPSDVLAGWAGSLGWVGGVHLLLRRYFRQSEAVGSPSPQPWLLPKT